MARSTNCRRSKPRRWIVTSPRCRECREQAHSFRDVSHAFALYIRETAAPPVRSNCRWLLFPAAIAAALLVACFCERLGQLRMSTQHSATSRAELPRFPRTAPVLIAKAARPHVHRRTAKRAAPWMPAEPTIQLLIPADALFPPGALPEGVGFVADFRLASDGSPGGLISRP